MGVPARVYHGLQRMARAGDGMLWRGYNNRFKRPVARFWYWPIRWHTRGLFLALLAHFGALLGLCAGLAMLARARAGL